MAVLDFLFQGSPPPQVTQYGSTTTSVPDWWAAYTQGLIGKANAISAEPYQPYGGPRVADFSDAQNQAFNLTQSNTGIWSPYTAQAASMMSNAGSGPGALGASQPFMDQALSSPGAMSGAGWIEHAAQMNGVNAASPHLSSASDMINTSGGMTVPQTIDQYMNPYTSMVTDRIADLGARNLHENLLPGVNDTFTRSGQFGSSRHGDFTGRAIRDTQDAILGAQSGALERGYTQAGQQAQTDLARQLQAGQASGALGQVYGNLTHQGQQNLGALGSALGNLANQDRQFLGQLGATSGNLASADLARLLSAGQNIGALGQTIQNMGQRDAAALEAVGVTQQQQEQKNLDTAYKDFLDQREYPRNNIRFLNEAIRGMSPPSTQTNTASTGPGNNFQPSPLAQVAGIGSSMYVLNQLFGNR